MNRKNRDFKSCLSARSPRPSFRFVVKSMLNVLTELAYRHGSDSYSHSNTQEYLKQKLL